MASLSSRTATALGLALLVLEALIGARAVFAPKVSPAYRAFYIQHLRDCWLPDAESVQLTDELRRQVILPDTLSPGEACFLLAHGWGQAWGETWDRTAISHGHTAWMELPPPPGAAALIVTLRADRPGTVRLTLGSGPTLTLHLAANTPQDARLAVTGDAQGALQLRFNMWHWQRAGALTVLRLRWVD